LHLLGTPHELTTDLLLQDSLAGSIESRFKYRELGTTDLPLQDSLAGLLIGPGERGEGL
jgi:hypothetical protein